MALETLIGHVLLVEVDEELAAATARRLGAPPVTAGDVDGALRELRPDPSSFAVVVVGAGVRSPIRVAQQVGAIDAELAVVLLVTDDRLDEIRRALQFAPFLPEDVVTGSITYPEIAASAITTAADRTSRRRAHRETMRAAASRLGMAGGVSRDIGQQMLGAVLNEAPIAVLTLDPRRQVTSANPYAERLFAQAADDLTGTSIASLVPGDQRPALQRALDAASAGRTTTERLSRQTASGRQTLEVTASPFRVGTDAGGAILLLQELSPRPLGADERERLAARIRREVVAPLDAVRRQLVDRRQTDLALALDDARDRARAVVAELSGAADG